MSTKSFISVISFCDCSFFKAINPECERQNPKMKLRGCAPYNRRIIRHWTSWILPLFHRHSWLWDEYLSLGSATRNIDWRIFIDTIPRLPYTKPTSKSQTNNSYDYETFVIVIILNNVSVCRSKTWYKVKDMISKFSAGSAGDSILMNNSMQEAFDLTDIFLHTHLWKNQQKIHPMHWKKQHVLLS